MRLSPVPCMLLLLAAASVQAQEAQEAQEKFYDETALRILDHTSAVIGDLGSCGFELHVMRDVLDPNAGQWLTKFVDHQVYMVGPDKMLVDSWLDDGHRGYWYNGQTVTYYSYGENNYAILEAPDNILAMISSVHDDYGVDFPAADFFYPTFTDDLIEKCNAIEYLGIKQVDGKSCFHIVAVSETLRVQFWIADDAFNLPLRFAITRLDEPERPQYMASFSNWQINPDLPVSMFDFQPPGSAGEIVLMPRNSD